MKPGQDIEIHLLIFANVLKVLRRQQGHIPDRLDLFLVQLQPCFWAELRLGTGSV